MKKLFAVALSALLATVLVSCGEKKSKKDFDYINDKGEIIWNTGYLTVTFEDYDETLPLAPTIKLKAENKSDKHISLFTSDFYVNDRCISVLSAEGIESGETAELELQLSDGAVENSYIDEIGQVSFYLASSNPESTDKNDMYTYSDEIIIKTDNKNWKENKKIPSGEILYDNDELQISALLDDKNFINGYTLPIYIKNNREDTNICLSKMRINGKETDVSDVNFILVRKGKDAVKFMTVYPAYEDIDEYSRTEVQFTVSAYGNDSETFTTDYITIKGLTEKED